MPGMHSNQVDMDGVKHPLVLIPGAMSTEVSWRYQISSLGTDREIVVPAEHYACPSIKGMAAQIACELPPIFDLVAWSMGGYIAFQLYPLVAKRVRRLVLICTSARPESEAARARRAQVLKSVSVEGLHAVYERDIRSNFVDARRIDTEFAREVLAEVRRLGEQTLRAQFAAMGEREDARPLLKDIAAEALVISARMDAITPADCSVEIASLLPRARLHVVEDAGHLAPWERSDEVNAAIREFLEKPSFGSGQRADDFAT